METRRNRYLLLRHGRSLANEAGLIISDPRDGIGAWGLADGVADELEDRFKDSSLPRNLRIFSSPFDRALETAWAVARATGGQAPTIRDELRERWFGSWDRRSDGFYPEVWSFDAMDPDNSRGGVESPSAVFRRLWRLIAEIESQGGNSTVLLVSHGDPLNILLTGTAGLGLERHRDIPPMETAEIREL